MKKRVARAVLILLALALYGVLLWGLPFLNEEGPFLERVLYTHVLVVGLFLFLFGLSWAIKNCERK